MEEDLENLQRTFGYQFGIDVVSGKSMHHASFLLQHFMPSELVRDEAHEKIVEGDLDESYPGIVEYRKAEKQWTFLTGSRAEGLGVPAHWLDGAGKLAVAADRDEMICYPNWFLMESLPESYPGREGPMFEVEPLDDPNSQNFGRLKITDVFRTAVIAAGNPVSKKYFSNLPLKEKMYKMKQSLSGSYNVELHGPSVSLVDNPLGPLMDRDECLAFAFAEWPKTAEEWLTRHRPSGWPSQLLITDLSQKGYFMVPVGRHGSPDTEYEWRCSFSLAERSLARSLKPVIRKVYVVLKMLHSFFLKEPGVLPSYAIKTLVFWFCETHDMNQWTEGDVASLVYCLLDEILHGLVRRNIRHYFIPCVNLLARASPENIITLSKKVVYVRKHLVECMAKIADRVNFWGLLSAKCFTWLSDFKNFLKSLDSPKDVGLFKVLTTGLLDELFREYVRTFRVNEENSDGGTTGFLKKIYQQRFLRILRTTTMQLKDVVDPGATEAFDTFLLKKLSMCNLGDWAKEPESVLAKTFLWLSMDHHAETKPNLRRIAEACSKVLNDESLSEQPRLRLQKMSECLTESKLPVVKIHCNSYGLFKQYYISENAGTRLDVMNLLTEHLTKLPTRRGPGFPYMPEVEAWQNAKDTIFHNSDRGGRVCCYRFGLDPLSGASLHHLSFILRHFLPLELVRDETQQKILEGDSSENMSDVMDWISTKENKSELGKKHSMMTGSLAEGLGVPDYFFFPNGHIGDFNVRTRDRDGMLVELNWYKFEELPLEFEQYTEGPLFEVEAVEGGEANYARLKFTHCFRVAKEAVSGRALKSPYFNNYSAKEDLLKIYKDVNVFPDVEVHGPCVTLLLEGSQGSPDRDNCLAIAFKEWPEVASEWLTRKRPSGWPSPATVRDISQKGFCMVPVGRHNVEGAELEWRYSFSIAERILARSLPPIVRKAYILLKLLHSFYMKQPGVLPTYCLKTLLFWTCEEQSVSQWTEADMAGLLYCMLDRVIQALVRHEVRHYFIPEVNLLQQVPREHTNTLLQTVTNLRRNLAEPVLSIAKQVVFQGLTGVQAFTQLPNFNAFVKAMSRPLDKALFRNVSQTLCRDLLQQYVDRIRANEKCRNTGTIRFLKQAQRKRFLRILHDIVLEMKCAERYAGPYKEYLLVNLSNMNEEPLLLAKIYDWLVEYHVRHRTTLAEMKEHTADRRKREEFFNDTCALIIILNKDENPEKKIERVQEICKCLSYPGVVGLDLDGDNSTLYKQYYSEQTGETLQPMVDMNVLPSLPIFNKEQPLCKQPGSTSEPPANPLAALGPLLGNMSGAPVNDLDSLLKASQEMFKWVQETQKLLKKQQ